ncbi:MAG: hypothetical protein KatS3mg104_3244 [Phycisphaerae bacterium]|nr:MAG: hypothetical protein KatS3mg104_3244 [Phycisphaerae bacterium]
MKHHRSHLLCQRWMALAAAVVLAFGPSSSVAALTEPIPVQDQIDTLKQNEVELYQGDLVSLKVYGLTRVAITDPEVADVASAELNELLLVGRTPGETPVFIWDQHGKRMIIARVIGESLDVLAVRMRKLLEAAGITTVTVEKNNYEGKLVATGTIIRDQEAAYNLILDRFPDKVLDLVRVDGDLIQIDAQVTELNTTLSKELGIDWEVGTNSLGTRDDFLGLEYKETVPTMTKFKDLFKIGDFQRTTAILATVNMLIEEGKARILSKPSILVANGEEASILVGGEIPIRTTITSTGGTSIQEDVRFKEYGVDLTVTPEIKGDKIDVVLSVAVRDIDNANAVGEDVAFTVRSAETRLLLENGQTIVIAGLIKQQESETVTRVPFLSAIPVVGALFRNVKTPTANQDQEVVIALTPRIVRQPKTKDLMAPKEEEGTTSDETGSGKPKVINVHDGQQAGETEEPQDATSNGSSSDDEKVSALIETSEEAKTSTESAEQRNDLQQKDRDLSAEQVEDQTQTSVSVDLTKEKETPDGTANTLVLSEGDQRLKERAHKALASYARRIQEDIAASTTYPLEAQEQGWEGTVVLAMKVLSDGRLDDVYIKQSSGHEIFDKDALNTALIVSPFAAFPAEVEADQIELTVPIVYTKDTRRAQLQP